MGPELGGRGHDVEVAQEQERLAARPVAAETGDHRAAAGHHLEDLWLETGIGQGAGDPARDARLAVRCVGWHRVDRGNPDQRPERLDELIAGRSEDAVAEGDRGQRRGRGHDQAGLPTRPSRPVRSASTPRTNPERTMTTTMITRIRSSRRSSDSARA